MRTPTWESSKGSLAAYFATGKPLRIADVWTFTLASGAQIRWSGADVPITVGGRYFALGPGVTRGLLKWRVGISSDTLSCTLNDIGGTVINGQPLPAFVRAGGFDGATVLLERVFFEPGAIVPLGALLWFVGDVEDAEGDRYEAVLQMASFTKRLEVAVPRDVYQPQCLNRVYGKYCGLSAAAWTIAGTAASSTDGYRSSFAHGITTKPAGWGTLGLITFTGGANLGVSRTCRAHSATHLQALQPWPYAVAPGDTFTLRAGCDQLKATCESKFSNKARFRGTPFVPASETVL